MTGVNGSRWAEQRRCTRLSAVSLICGRPPAVGSMEICRRARSRFQPCGGEQDGSACPICGVLFKHACHATNAARYAAIRLDPTFCRQARALLLQIAG
jgi:hypothetical protein